MMRAKCLKQKNRLPKICKWYDNVVMLLCYKKRQKSVIILPVATYLEQNAFYLIIMILEIVYIASLFDFL